VIERNRDREIEREKEIERKSEIEKERVKVGKWNVRNNGNKDTFYLYIPKVYRKFDVGVSILYTGFQVLYFLGKSLQRGKFGVIIHPPSNNLVILFNLVQKKSYSHKSIQNKKTHVNVLLLVLWKKFISKLTFYLAGI
jgi:hypothetical protein